MKPEKKELYFPFHEVWFAATDLLDLRYTVKLTFFPFKSLKSFPMD